MATPDASPLLGAPGSGLRGAWRVAGEGRGGGGGGSGPAGQRRDGDRDTDPHRGVFPNSYSDRTSVTTGNEGRATATATATATAGRQLQSAIPRQTDPARQRCPPPESVSLAQSRNTNETIMT